jgi:hypothetical protein
MFLANDRDEGGGPDEPRGERPRKIHRSGVVLILCILAFGGAMLLVLFLAPRATNPAPSGLAYGVPARAVRLASIDLRSFKPQANAAIDRIRATEPRPDIVLLQSATVADAAKIADSFNIPADAAHQAFYPSQNFGRPGAEPGNAILSKFPLFSPRSIPSRGGSFGVWADAVADGVKFIVASVETIDETSQVAPASDIATMRRREMQTLADAWRELGGPPMIVGAHTGGWPTDHQASPATMFASADHGTASPRAGDEQLIAAFAPELGRWSVTDVKPFPLPANDEGFIAVTVEGTAATSNTEPATQSAGGQ